MGSSLNQIAQTLQGKDKKVQLIYAFNGMGKTRLSREFKSLIAPKQSGGENGASEEATRTKILYYNAFTEDLFYWDNDLEADAEPKLKIHPNSFTDWVLRVQGQDQNVIANFQRYADNKLTPQFDPSFEEVTFSFQRGTDDPTENVKISRGEETNFIWSIFYTILEQVIAILNVPEVAERETDQFNQLQYVFIDDPVSSLDENHLIELGVNLAALISSSTSPDLKFVITTHNPLFYNVLANELGTRGGYLLQRLEDGTFDLLEKLGDSNSSFSYHLFLKQTLELAVAEERIQKYHFTLLRNLYEKTASFLGYPRWADLLPDDKTAYFRRIVQFTSHSTLSAQVVAEPTPEEKQIIRLLLTHLCDNYRFWRLEEQNA
ncbi:MAG: anticodon nuclease [Hydrogenophaga sp.]|nr:anticodon nuclease [Hydrogenophaga sp.]